MASRKNKVIAIMLASLTGVSGITATSAIVAYEAMFPRVERKDPTLTPGVFFYERIKDSLPRQEMKYQVKDSTLQGYYYPSEEGKGVVIVVHGMKSGGDDYLPIIEYMVRSGFDVFSYDCTGTYNSSGDSTVGMCQSLIDLEGTISYVQSSGISADKPMFLIGHSWGGYAAASVLALCPAIKGCAAIAGMHNACTLMTEKAEQYVGKLSVVPAPVFAGYQRLLFKDYVDHNAVKGINSTNAPVLVAHGVDDKTILWNKQSIISYKDEFTNPNVEYYIGKGLQGGHDSIWHSTKAIAYQMQVESELKLLELEKGEKLNDEEKRAYYATVDHALYSQVNEELMMQIVQMFNKAL